MRVISITQEDVEFIWASCIDYDYDLELVHDTIQVYYGGIFCLDYTNISSPSIMLKAAFLEKLWEEALADKYSGMYAKHMGTH